MTPPPQSGGQQGQSSFQAWARSDGWIELQPLMVERRNRCLVIDCIVASVQFETPETARDPGYPAVLALECPETSIEAAMITLHRIMDAGGSLHLLRNTDENTVILLAGVEVWVLKPPSR